MFVVFFSNDLPDSENSVRLLYADHATFVSLPTPKFLFYLDLSPVAKRSNKHELPLNDKTSQLTFGDSDERYLLW